MVDKLSNHWNIQYFFMASQAQPPEKITQLQCNECNEGLQSQFLYWLNDSFKYQPQILQKIHHELEALLGLAQFLYTIGRDKPQAGDFLQNIQYERLTKKQKILWLTLSVFLPYLIKRISSYASDKDTPFWRTVLTIFNKLQRILTVVDFINYAIFILKGQFRSTVQRILQMKMKFIDPGNKRILNFSLMNRMLIWRVYQFFLKNALPSFFSFCSGPLKNVFYLSSFMKPQPSQQTNNCVFCSSPQPVMPYQAAPCQHKACYYCCKSNNSQKCPLCSVNIETWGPLLH